MKGAIFVFFCDNSPRNGDRGKSCTIGIPIELTWIFGTWEKFRMEERERERGGEMIKRKNWVLNKS